MFFLGVWDEFQQTLPEIEEDPQFGGYSMEDWEEAVHIHYTSSLSRTQCHLLSYKQYLQVFGIWLANKHTATKLVHILSGCVGSPIRQFRIWQR
jgi:hypothetical protein